MRFQLFTKLVTPPPHTHTSPTPFLVISQDALFKMHVFDDSGSTHKTMQQQCADAHIHFYKEAYELGKESALGGYIHGDVGGAGLKHIKESCISVYDLYEERFWVAKVRFRTRCLRQCLA